MEHSKEYYRLELANSLTHGLGALLSVVGLCFLIAKAIEVQNDRLLASFLIYGIGITFLFTASTLYHGIHRQPAKRVLHVMDHIGIYLMIAGTYTPFAMVTLERSWGDLLLLLVWSIAGAGTLFKLFFTGRFNLLSTFIYLGMGWLAVVAANPMVEAIPVPGLALIVAGGLFFSVGVIFYLWQRLKYHHAIWHLFVLAGGVCHYFAIFFYTT
jgi:hemolysin III